MALVPCRKCGASVAESAVRCPKCGEPDPAGPFIQPRKKNKVARNMVIVAVALVAAIALIVVVPAFVQDAKEKKQENAVQAKADAAVQSFVSEYGNRYSDPVGTYDAEKAYEVANKGALMTADGISSYDMTAVRETVSTLGFEYYRLPLAAKFDQATSMKIFNKYTAKELSLYMNLLARNPMPEAVAIIDFEFTHYCSKDAVSFPEDDQAIETMMETAKGVVAEYGSAANYTVAHGSTAGPDPAITDFIGAPFATDWDESGKPTTFGQTVDMAIFVDTYQAGSQSETKKALKNFQLAVRRWPTFGSDDYTFVSIGQDAIIQ